MKVKIFDFEHEKDLEDAVNKFLTQNNNIKDIKYQTSHFFDGRDQIYSFSCMIVYNEDNVDV